MTLANARIDQLPTNALAKKKYLAPIWNDDLQLTESIPLEQIARLADNGQNFAWVSDNDPGYQTDDVVTYGGTWWISLIDNNLNNIPGVDPTKWDEIPKSNSWDYWVAGVYADTNTFVLSDHKGYTDIYKLISATRPYVSSNIQTEEDSGNWQSIVSPINKINGVNGSGTLDLDFTNDLQKVFVLSASEAKTWSIVRGSRAVKFSALLSISGGAWAQTLPGSFKTSDTRISSNIFTPLSTGLYIVEGVWNGTNWGVTISQEPLT